ncbi:RWD domain-containing protein 1-like [Halichondria panicea]|uniref:RWD domain-containing protein 1-like n=1 Tax=Halichondria panicea TaxID=6063 RepID=UPI00312B8E02
MTDYIEEQEGEFETLCCIYTEGELTKTSSNPTCFQMHVEPASGEEEDCSVSVDIQFSYPPTYPDEVPGVEIVDQTGLSPEQVTELETFLNEQAVENLGMVMIFTLVGMAQDKLVELMDSVKELQEQENRQKQEELKRKEEAKFHGTPVTKEAFLEWRERFDQEMRETTKQIKVSSSSKLTGRLMFEQDASLALSDTRFLTEASAVAEMDLKDVEVDESLFQDLEDLDIEEQT